MSDEPLAGSLPADTPAPAESTATDPESDSPAASVRDQMAATFDEIQGRDTVRGADGKFTPRGATTATATTETTDQPENGVTEPAKPGIEPPHSWSADARAKWDAVPPELKPYLAQRDTDATRKISDQGQQLKALEGVSAVVERGRPQLLAAYGSVEKGVSDLLELHRVATSNPAGFLVDFARSAGIDLAQLAHTVASMHAPVDPQFAALRSEVDGLKHAREQERRAADHRELSGITSTVEAFAAKPANKHFEAVQEKVASLLNARTATTLEDAYEQACWLVPEVRTAMLAERAVADRAATDAKAREAADRARRMGGPAIGRAMARGAAVSNAGNVRETMRQAYDRMNGAA